MQQLDVSTVNSSDLTTINSWKATLVRRLHTYLCFYASYGSMHFFEYDSYWLIVWLSLEIIESFQGTMNMFPCANVPITLIACSNDTSDGEDSLPFG